MQTAPSVPEKDLPDLVDIKHEDVAAAPLIASPLVVEETLPRSENIRGLSPEDLQNGHEKRYSVETVRAAPLEEAGPGACSIVI